MVAQVQCDFDDRAVEYCRRARRLRCRLAAEPAHLHASLRELARREDQVSTPMRGRAPSRYISTLSETVLGVPEVSAEHFARLVTGQIRQGVLHYSQRRSLIRAAARLG